MITLIALRDDYFLYQIDTNQEIPACVFQCSFYSITKTPEEVSIITNLAVDIKPAKSTAGWKGFKVKGILDFSLIGIIHDITSPLKEHAISVFVTSTYNTDYLFVKAEAFEEAINVFMNTAFINLLHDPA